MSDPADCLPKRRWWQRLFRITTSGEYIRELDGLRFLAIAVVLTAHTWGNWLNHTATAYVLDDPSFLNAVMIPLVVAISAVSFVLVERPCMDRHWPRKLWKRLFPESTSGRNRKSEEAGG